jgi:transaldolase
MNQLEQLKKMTKVVADTGDIETLAQYKPLDATTNPTLILKAASQPQYQELVVDAVRWAQQHYRAHEAQLHWAIKKLLVIFGVKILQIVPGRVSTEVDARLSFDTAGSVHQAQELISLYHQAGVGRERILIKIAATWEGIQAAYILEQQGIHCNLTLMFDLTQAIACAEAGVTLISPFVGRIYDWYQKNKPGSFTEADDPGVLSVKQIYEYLRHYDYPTLVMGASFRHINQIRHLAGCDLLTISPVLLQELQTSEEHLPRRLQPENNPIPSEKIILSEKDFRWRMNENPMATEKLAEGIRLFNSDLRQLELQLSLLL